MDAGGNQSCQVSHVNNEFCIYPIGYLPKSCEIYYPGISACARNYELGLMFQSQFFHMVVIYRLSFSAYSVGNEVEEPAGKVDPAAMGEVTPVSQAHRKH